MGHNFYIYVQAYHFSPFTLNFIKGKCFGNNLIFMQLCFISPCLLTITLCNYACPYSLSSQPCHNSNTLKHSQPPTMRHLFYLKYSAFPTIHTLTSILQIPKKQPDNVFSRCPYHWLS